MATIALGTDLTLMELLNRLDPNGMAAQFIDVLNQQNRILEDITWLACNDGTYHEDTRTLTEPAGSLRAYDEGITKEAGRTQKITEPTCMVNGLSEVDDAKLRHNSPDIQGARLQEDGFFLRGMTKGFVSRLFDGNRGTDERDIYGINQRSDYNALSSSYVYNNVGSGQTCADASTFTSAYIIQWGFKKVNCIYPRNDPAAPAGAGAAPVKTKDFGLNIITDAASKKFPAWQTWFGISVGLFIHDPRCIKRICNIATAANPNGTTYQTINEDALIDATNDLEYNGEGAVIYCNKSVFKQLQKRANEKGTFIMVDREGEGPFAHPVVTFMGIPIKRVDQITNTQDDVT